MVPTSFRSVVGRAGPIGRFFSEGNFCVEVQIAINLAGRDVVEAANTNVTSRFEHGLGSQHIGGKEARGVKDGE